MLAFSREHSIVVLLGTENNCAAKVLQIKKRTCQVPKSVIKYIYVIIITVLSENSTQLSQVQFPPSSVTHFLFYFCCAHTIYRVSTAFFRSNYSVIDKSIISTRLHGLSRFNSRHYINANKFRGLFVNPSWFSLCLQA